LVDFICFVIIVAGFIIVKLRSIIVMGWEISSTLAVKLFVTVSGTNATPC
jgi:hypothetical protein